ncbi:hypothetical protein HanRHA438_Chr02g0048891 [Helianthus annuus]|nr:hypothetical protein HanRHA438_Chr02g0048891 [Helianthus annuus]
MIGYIVWVNGYVVLGNQAGYHLFPYPQFFLKQIPYPTPTCRALGIPVPYVSGLPIGLGFFCHNNQKLKPVKVIWAGQVCCLTGRKVFG